MMVKTFNRAKLLSYPKLGGTIVEIDDIGIVADHDETTLNPGSKDFINAKLSGAYLTSTILAQNVKFITEIPGKHTRCINAMCRLSIPVVGRYLSQFHSHTHAQPCWRTI